MFENLEIAETKAKEKLPKEIFDHIAGGAGEEVTLQANREAYLRINFLPKVLIDVSAVDIRMDLLGLNLSSPVIVAPMSFHGLVNEKKELATVRACSQSETLMIVSMMSNVTLESLAKENGSKLWFQIHIHKNRSITEGLIKRAEKAGYKAIVITVDIPQKGYRKRDIQNNFSLPVECIPANFINEQNQIDNEAIAFNPSTTWEDIKWVKTLTRLPIVLKGIMHPSDAIMAVKMNVDGIIVSNHGGRQLDGTVASIEALPGIVKVVANKIPIIVDGGIRSGADVTKALALGAQAVLIGRPILWGLAIDGEKGVLEIIKCLKRELENSMRLLGYASLISLKKEGRTIVLSHNTNEATIERLIKKIDELSLELNCLKNAIKGNSAKEGSYNNMSLFPKL